MKPLFSCVLLCMSTLLFAANLIPNGDLKNPAGEKPYLRKFVRDGKDSPNLKTSFVVKEDGGSILLESSETDGITEVNYSRLSGVEAGKKYYLCYQFTPITFGAGARTSCRIAFFDAAGKHLKNDFSAPHAFREAERQDFIHSFTVPAGTARVHLTLWFSGVQKTEVNRVSLDTALPVGADGNLLMNGSFESPTMADYYIVPKLHGKVYKAQDRKLFTERSMLKAKTGKYSLLSSSDFEQATNEINLNMLPFRSGAKYRFTVNYFVASGEGKMRIAGRITYWNKEKKVIGYQFPEGDATPGKWQKMNLEFYPPVGTARITVTLWLSGRMQVYLDDLYFGEVREKKVPGRNAGASILFRNSSFTLWKEAPYLKVPANGIPEGVQAGERIAVSAAANESEPFQLVLSPREDFGDVHLSFSDLKGENGVIPASNLSFRVVGFVNLKNPDNPSVKGWNADPLLPDASANAEKGKNLPFYVTVKVPKGQKRGSYLGTVRVMSGTKELASVPLSVRVRGFALPDTAFLRTYFYAQPIPAYMEFDRRPRAVIADDLQRALSEHRMNGNQAQWTLCPKWNIENGKLTVTDWSRFDAQVEKWHKQYGMVNIPVPLLTMMGDNAGWWGGDRSKPGKSPFGNFGWLSPEGLKYAGEFAKQVTEHVKAKFPDVNFYAYLYDEPPAKVHADLAKITNALHEAAPGLRVFVPKQVNDEIGYVQTFCVPMAPGYLNQEKQKKALEAGRDIWYYNWSVRIDSHDYIRNRLFAWQIYAADGSGGLLWNTIMVQKGINPWNDLDKTHSCGGATIFYPPRKDGEGVISSLRSAQIRESIDDFDYMRILEKKIDALFPGQGKNRVKEIVRTLIPEIPFGYRNDPHLLYALRDRIADEIESLDQPPAVIVVSNPPDHAATELSEVKFSVFGPAGSVVRINGGTVGKIGAGKRLDVPFLLGKLGRNEVALEVMHGSGRKSFRRAYELKPDPQLKELRGLLAKARSNGVDAASSEAFLKRIEQGGAYTEEIRNEARKQIESLKYAVVVNAVRDRKTFANPLERAMFERAKRAFERRQFECAEYYLNLCKNAADAGGMKHFKVSVSPVDYEGHPGFVLDNGIISATVLETGGRIISFKVRGVECLAPGSFGNALSVSGRAARKVTKDMVTRLHGYGGYEDAGGDGVWPVSFVDWDVRFLELKPDRVALSFETRLPDTPFLFRRTLSMRAETGELKMDYEIANVMPPGTESDDPEHYQLAWRGRFVPAIGNTADAQENDRIVLPVKAEDRLAETHFSSAKPANYERRSIRLTAPYMGAFDPALKTGIAMIGGPLTTHAYVWFNSKGDHKGGGRLYTLEFPRSFYGKVFNDPEANSPLSVKPGESVSFTITLRGISGVATEQEFLEKIR